MDRILIKLFKVKTQTQLYHLQTRNYNRHVASGKLYEFFDTSFDQFIETMQKEKRIKLRKPMTIRFVNTSDKSFYGLLVSFKKWLVKDLPKLIKINEGLVAQRDEIVSKIDHALYLMSFK